MAVWMTDGVDFWMKYGRLTDLHFYQKEDRISADGDADSPALRYAGDKEEAIKARLAKVSMAFGQFSPLVFGIPDADRVYLTQAARSLPGWPVERWAAEKEERRKLVEGSEYLRRHPEMLEELFEEHR